MRDEVWTQLILADTNARYFAALLGRRVAKTRRLALAAAVVSCGAMLAAVAKVFPDALPFVSAVGALLAILSTHEKTPPELIRSAVEWRQVEREADRLWSRTQAGEELTRSEIDEMRTHAANACRIYPEAEVEQALVDAAYDAALRFRGVDP